MINNTMLMALLIDIQTDINYLKKLAEKLIEMNKEDDTNDRQ
jgi:hypothetical protein